MQKKYVSRAFVEHIAYLLRAEKEGRLVVLENIDDPLSLEGLSLFLQNRADAKGVLNEYDKMLMREASYRLAEAARRGGEGK